MNKNQPSVKLNFLMNILLTMSSFIFPLITFPYIARVLEADGNGKIQLAISIITLFSVLAQLGIPTYGIRACAAVRDDKEKLSRTVHELTVVQIFTTLLSFGLFLLCLFFVPKLREEKTLYLVTSMMIFLSNIGAEWMFKALEKYTYITVRSLLFKVISIVAMFMLVREKGDYVIYAAINVFASVGSNILNLTKLHKYIYIKPVGNYNIKRHIKPVLVLFSYVCATIIYTTIDSVMLGFMTTDTEVGYYSVAIKIKNILVSVVTALSAVLLPRAAYYFEQGNLEEFWRLVAKALRVVILIAAPFAVYFMIYAKSSIFFLSGEMYEASVVPMMVLMPTLLFIGITSITGVQVLIPMNKEKIVLIASIIGALVDCIINAILIPSLGATGVAIGTLIAEIIVFLIQYAVLRKQLNPMIKNLRLGLIAVAIIISSLLSFWVASLQLSHFLTLLISAFLFFGSYILVLHFGKEEELLDMERKGLKTLKKFIKK